MVMTHKESLVENDGVQGWKLSRFIFGVVDIWHPEHGVQEVRSDGECFKTLNSFFAWIKQHHGILDDVYIVEVRKGKKEG